MTQAALGLETPCPKSALRKPETAVPLAKVTKAQAHALTIAISQTIDFYLKGARLCWGHDARNTHGRPCDIHAPGANAFCINGAFLRTAKPESKLYHSWIKIAHHTASQLTGNPKTSLFDFNDNHAQSTEDAIWFLDRAMTETLNTINGAAAPAPLFSFDFSS